MKDVDEPKVTELIRGVLQQAFAVVHRQDQCDLLPPSRLLPAECTEWYMKQLLQVCKAHLFGIAMVNGMNASLL